MGVRIERLPDEPIILVTIEQGYNMNREARETNEAISNLIGAGESGVYLIYDLRFLQMSFSDLVVALADNAQKSAGTASDSRLRPVVVGSGEMIKLGNMAMQQEQYGGLKIPMFPTPEEALSFIRDQLRKNR